MDVMVVKTAYLVPFLSVVLVAYAAREQDRIVHLLGFNQDLNFKQYSGFLETGSGKYLHYWLVESQKSPQTDPLVVWLNGGPGCSSLTGLLEENGPFRIAPDGMTLSLNPESWNRLANVLYIEAPAGVGFSYSKSENYTIDDDQTADDNFAAIGNFYSKFPEYQGRDLYITGESYAGIYVPTLSARIVMDPRFNVKGFAVGNGLSDTSLNDNSMVYFAYYHGLIGSKTWKELLSSCCPGPNAMKCPFSEMAKKNKTCNRLFSQVYLTSWVIGLNPYNLYSECAGGVPTSAVLSTPSQVPNLIRPIGIAAQTPDPHEDTSDASALFCTDSTSTTTYLNRPEVREALHIPRFVRFWAPCSLTVSETYQKTYENVSREYMEVLNKGGRILIYNGDVDMACNFLGDEWFVDTLSLKVVSGQKEWYYTDESGSRQVAGQVQQYEGLTFVTIRGSGHFVPTDKPIPAFNMFQNFINDVPY